ncbi:MAG: amidohydrolase family protein [Psychrobium sp.]|nr:amidohydrolase family protein [Psychrobium sp.]
MKLLQSKLKQLVLVSAWALGMTQLSIAHDMVPGKKQSQAILISGATLHTVSNGVLANTDILFNHGKITAIGSNLNTPANTKVIDASGKHVYPGLISMASQLGLREIESVKATVDIREVGEDNPHLLAHVAYNPDSEIIPTIRANGITHVQVTPAGHLLGGQSSVINLDAWNVDDGLVKGAVGIHLFWPSKPASWVSEKRLPKALTRYQDRLTRMYDYFEQSKRYYNAYQADKHIAKDVRWHAMLGLWQGDKTLYVHATEITEIEQAMRFAQQQTIKLVIVGGNDAWMVAKQLAEQDVAVVYTNAFGLPERGDEDIDQAFKSPAMLHQAGVTLAIGYESAWDSRSLAFAAGMASSYGLSKEQALRAITLTPAQLMGVDKILGSLEVGKSASLIISQGDVLDYQGHKVELMFIDGRLVDLNNRHRQLYNKYRQKNNE